MKSSVTLLSRLGFILFSCSIIVSCKKEINDHFADKPEPGLTVNETYGHLLQTKTFSTEAARKWQDMQLRILRLPAGPSPFGMHGVRYFAYCGIALYEAVLPGMPDHQSLHGQLAPDMPAMPSAEPGKAYHWPTSVNAALAFMNKSFFTNTNTSADNIAAIDSLEQALNAEYQTEVNAETFRRSAHFGKTVAQRIFNWSKTDGSLTDYPPYEPTTNPTLWSPTAPSFAVFAPYWGKNRLFVPGSLTGTSSPLPPAYSTDPNSDYYQMVKEVYDISQALTPEQTATALYFRDNPGWLSGAHYISIFSQIMDKENPSLDFYAVAHAKTGITLADAQIGCWKLKYELLVDRPIRYIRNVLGHTTWNSLLSTPPHPEFPSGHSQTGGAFATVLTSLYGTDYKLTLHTYDYLGMAPRSYNSFHEMTDDIGRSRVYAGIHYTYTCRESSKLGNKIAGNILSKLIFKKI